MAVELRRRLLAGALATLSAGAAWIALRPEPAAVTTAAAATRPLWSPARVPALLAEASGTVDLEAAVDGLLSGDGLAREDTCLVVYEGDRPVVVRRPDEALIPASTQKILVAAAALERLGPDHRYRTRLVAARPATGGTVGDLWLVGDGDPLLSTPEYAAAVAERPRTADRPLTPLAGLAAALVEAGVTQVTGTLRGDDTRYDQARTVPTWKPSYIADNEVGPLGALMVDGGFPDFVPPETRAEDPAAHAAAELAGLFPAAGVTLSGPTGSGPAPSGAVTVAEVRSAPLADVVAAMVRESDNTSAELVTRELGRDVTGVGSTKAGAEAVETILDTLGLPTGGLSLHDGSGLEVTNRATCGLLAATLRSVPALRGFLAVAGRSGTLALRLVDTPLEGRLAAKTGSLQGVTGITGFVKGRRDLSFALVANGTFGATQARVLQDRIATVLADYPAPRP